MPVDALQSCDDATELQQRERDTMTSKKHLLFLLLTILRKRLKLLLLRLLSSAFACSNHCDISYVVARCRKERGKKGKGKQEQGNGQGKQGWERSVGKQAEESGGSYEDVSASGARFGRKRGCGREGSLGHVLWECLRSRVEGMVCYWLVRDVVPVWFEWCCLFVISCCCCFMMM
jgi:hypothetical protein